MACSVALVWYVDNARFGLRYCRCGVGCEVGVTLPGQVNIGGKDE